jgi:hypothetical protein
MNMTPNKLAKKRALHTNRAWMREMKKVDPEGLAALIKAVREADQEATEHNIARRATKEAELAAIPDYLTAKGWEKTATGWHKPNFGNPKTPKVAMTGVKVTHRNPDDTETTWEVGDEGNFPDHGLSGFYATTQKAHKLQRHLDTVLEPE